MSEAESKALPPHADALPQTDVSGRARRRRHQDDPLKEPAFEPLRVGIEAHAESLHQQFGEPLAVRSVAKSAAKHISRLIAPNGNPGRPRSIEVTEAVRLHAEGLQWRVIYVRLGKRTRDEQYALRGAVRNRRYRARRTRQNSEMLSASQDFGAGPSQIHQATPT